MFQQAMTPDDLPSPIVDAGAMKGSDKGINIADRIALAAAVSVAMLILVMFALTYKSAMQPMPAAVSIVMSPYAGLHGSALDRRTPNAARKD